MTDDESIRAGRQALDHWVGGYPWYDRGADGLRPLDVSQPWYANVNWPNFRWPFSLPQGFFEWLLWLTAAALFAVLAYIAYRFWRNKAPGPADAGEKAGKGEEDAAAAHERRTEALPAPVARKRTDLLKEARRNYLEGRYGEAIIYLFSFELVELDKHRLVRLLKGKTNREYLKELGPRPPLRGLLEQTMVAFEDVFFGNYALDRARFETCWSRLDEFSALAAGEAV